MLAQRKCGQINIASGNTFIYVKERPDTYLLDIFTQWAPTTIDIR
jgi:hypothetical protein